MSAFFGRAAAWVLDHRPLAALLAALVALACIAGVARLDVDFSARAFFAGDGAALDRLDAHHAQWGDDDNTVIVVVDGLDQSVLAPERLAVLDELLEALEASEHSGQVLGLTRVPRLRRTAIGLSVPVALLDDLPSEPSRLEAWTAGVLADRALVPSLLSEDGTVTAVLVTLAQEDDDIGKIRPAVLALEAQLEDFQGRAGLSFGVAGIPVARAAMLEVLVGDQALFIPLAGSVMILLLYLMFRRHGYVIIPFVAAVLPMVMVLGVLGWTGEPVGLINQTYITLIPVIGVADAIHVVGRYHQELRGAPGLRRQAIIASIRSVGAACLLTSLTTIIGFLSLNLAAMPVLRSFGTYAGLGIAFAYLSVLVVVPLGLSFTSSGPPKGSSGAAGRWLVRTAELGLGWPRLVVGAGIALALVCGALALQVVVDNQLTGSLPPEHPVSITNGTVDRELGGVLATELALAAPAGRLVDPEVLTIMLEVEAELLQIDEVRAVWSPAASLASATEVGGGGYRIPPAAGVRSLITRLPMDTVLSEDQTQARMVVRTQDVGANAFLAVADEIEAIARPRLEAAGLDVAVTGTPVTAYDGVNRVTLDLRKSLMGAFGVITLLILILFRSWRLALVSILPNGLPLLIGYALLAILDKPLDPAPAVVFTVALGIAVDDTIHLLARYREELRAGAAQHDAIRASVRHSGHAVFVTSVMLAAGFGMNVLSSFPSNQLFGLLGAVVISAALVCDLVFIPGLLVLLHRPTRSV